MRNAYILKMTLYLIGQHLGAGLLSLLLVDELHEHALVLVGNQNNLQARIIDR